MVLFCFVSDIFAIVKPLIPNGMNLVNDTATYVEDVFVCHAATVSSIVLPVNGKVVYMSFTDVADSVYIAKFPNVVESD